MQITVISLVGFLALCGLVFFVNLLLTPGMLDAEAQQRYEVLLGRETALAAENSELKTPKRSRADEARLQIAKSALEKHGDQGITLLRHLRIHGKLVFGSFDPVLPAGIRGEQARALIQLLVTDQLVSVSQARHPGGYDYTYAIAPGMADVLDELLYPDT